MYIWGERFIGLWWNKYNSTKYKYLLLYNEVILKCAYWYEWEIKNFSSWNKTVIGFIWQDKCRYTPFLSLFIVVSFFFGWYIPYHKYPTFYNCFPDKNKTHLYLHLKWQVKIPKYHLLITSEYQDGKREGYDWCPFCLTDIHLCGSQGFYQVHKTDQLRKLITRTKFQIWIQ